MYRFDRLAGETPEPRRPNSGEQRKPKNKHQNHGIELMATSLALMTVTLVTCSMGASYLWQGDSYWGWIWLCFGIVCFVATIWIASMILPTVKDWVEELKKE